MGYLTGRLGYDPELRVAQSGKPVAKLRVAVDWTRRNGEERERETDWWNVVCWGKDAETAAKILQKGDLVEVVGAVRQTTYEDRSGQQRTGVEVQVWRFRKLSPKRKDEAASPADAYYFGDEDPGPPPAV